MAVVRLTKALKWFFPLLKEFDTKEEYLTSVAFDTATGNLFFSSDQGDRLEGNNYLSAYDTFRTVSTVDYISITFSVQT